MRALSWQSFVLLVLQVAHGCTRHAEIVDEPDGGLLPPGPMVLSDAGLIPVDAGSELGAGCAERPFGVGCRGANDFPCRFLAWVGDVAAACQERTGCRANGRFGVEMGAEGCVVGLAMSEPEAAFVRCAIEEFSAVRCECGAQPGEEFLGIGNDGCD